MNFTNLNQPAHGDRELVFVASRLRLARKAFKQALRRNELYYHFAKGL